MTSTTTTVILLMCVFAVGLSLGDNPGIQAGVSQSGIDFFKDIAMDVVKSKLSRISIPDQHFEKLGFHGDVTGGYCDNINLGNVKVDFGDGSVTLSTTGVGFHCQANWATWIKIIFKKISTGGSVTSDPNNLGLSLAVKITLENQKPILNVQNVNVNLDGLGVSFHGGIASAILNFFKGLISGAIRNAVAPVISDALTGALNNNVNQMLRAMEFYSDVPLPAPYNVASVDYGFTRPPLFTNNVVEVQLGGFFTSRTNRGPSPISPQSLPVYQPNHSDHQVELFLSKQFPESLGKVLFDANVVNFRIPSNVVPANILQLDTDHMEQFAPDIKKYYPNNQPVDLSVTPAAAPTLPWVQGASVVAPADIHFLTGDKELFVLFCNASATFNVKVTDKNGAGSQQRFIPTFEFHTCDFVTKSSNVGNLNWLNIAIMNGLLKFTLENVVVPKLNGVVANGVPLPNLGPVGLRDTIIDFADSYVQLSTNMFRA
eukprot:PhM_4_TR11679/c1_g1_i5/m.13325